jgi:phage antirepressor YoqD-like protein
VTAAIETIRIGSVEIECVRGPDGQPGVVVRTGCERLGLGYEGQRQKLADPVRSPWATTFTTLAVAQDGKNREVFCLHVESVPGWLATLDAGRVDEEHREKVIEFQRLAGHAVADWAYGRKPAALATREQRIAAALVEAQSLLAEKDATIAELAPPAQAWRDLADCSGDVNLQTAGKALGLPPNLWIAWLRANGHLFYRGRNLVARQDHLDAGRFVQRVRVKDGEEFIQTLVTPKGIAYWGERRPELRAPRRLLPAKAAHLAALPEARP